MDHVRKDYEIEVLIKDFEYLIENFRKFIAKSNCGIDLNSTKLIKYRNSLHDINVLSKNDRKNLINIVRKYCSVNILFENQENFSITDRKILSILNGKHTLDDKNENYNGYFFEIDAGVRFFQALKKKNRDFLIDISSDCDVIVRSEKLAIECKYINSKSKIRKGFSDALSQLDKNMISYGLEKGIIALDITSLIDEELSVIADDVFEFFAKKTKSIADSRSVFSNNFKENGILYSVINNPDFMKIISTYFSSAAEAVFCEHITNSEVCKIKSKNILPVFQANAVFIFEYDDDAIPIVLRVLMPYFLEEINDDSRKYFKELVETLLVGL